MLVDVRDTLIVIGAFVVCAGMLWLSYRIEPSWSSKDGHRFLCVGQEIQANGLAPAGRMKEMRGSIHPDGNLTLIRRDGLRRSHGDYRIIGAVAQAPRGRKQYLIAPLVDASEALDIVLRFPVTSRTVAAMDAVIARHAESAATEPDDTAGDAAPADSPDEPGSAEA
jgi:hypothetical protein